MERSSAAEREQVPRMQGEHQNTARQNTVQQHNDVTLNTATDAASKPACFRFMANHSPTVTRPARQSPPTTILVRSRTPYRLTRIEAGRFLSSRSSVTKPLLAPFASPLRAIVLLLSLSLSLSMMISTSRSIKPLLMRASAVCESRWSAY
jgi:hypothetical protein